MIAAAVSVLPVPVAISKRNRSLAFLDCRLNGVDGLLLVGAQEAKAVHLDEAGAFAFVLPGGFRWRSLGAG